MVSAPSGGSEPRSESVHERRFNPFRSIVIGVPAGVALWWAVLRVLGVL